MLGPLVNVSDPEQGTKVVLATETVIVPVTVSPVVEPETVRL